MIARIPNRSALLFVAALVAAPLFLAANAPRERLRFAPAEGSSLTKTFVKKATLSLEEQVIEGMSGSAAPDVEMTMVMNQRIVVTDDYAKMKDGVPQRLVRTFDELEGDVTASQKMELLGQRNEREQNMRSKSALTGKKVAFDWNAETSTYDKSFVPAEDDGALLAGLDEDMDLRLLLPPTDVAIGDTWDVDLAQFQRILAPGGNVALVPEATDDRSIKTSGQAQSLEQSIGKDLEGHARAKWTGTREVDGVVLARIELDVKVHSSNDLTESARKAQEDSDGPEGVEIDQVKIEYSLEGQGELLWDVASGHFRSFELSGQTSIKSNVRTQVEVNGTVRPISQTNALGGTSTFSATAK